MRKGAPCHLCSIYDPNGTVSGAKLCEHFHDRQIRTNYATYDPELEFQHSMAKMMRPNKPIIPLPRSYVDSILDDDWQGCNPISRVHNAINKKANAINMDSLTIRRDKPVAAGGNLISNRSSAARGATRPLSRAATTAIAEASGMLGNINRGIRPRPQPIVFGVDVPTLPTKPRVHVPNYCPDRYPANHLLTRRKGYSFVS